LLVIDSDITALKFIEEEIRQKNKDITDSIHYAKRIQQSILPSNEKIKTHLPEYFIFYQPKDIVSGDFYWMESVEDDTKIIVAAVDCTGHGVPGALLTIIGNDLLNHIVNEMSITDPKIILKEMNAGIINRFSIDEEELSREGMDMALITIDRSGDIPMLHYSGAYNSSFVIRDNELITLNAMRQHIGSIPIEKREDILSHSMELKKDDMIYIFSDGYADQIGGITGKKFMKGRFKELLMKIHQTPMEEQKRILEKSHYEWRGDTFQTDDMLVMGFRI
jgi:serine phosphatase RsbU (regulator of sigma subunit)